MDVWQRVLDRVEAKVTRDAYYRWFRATKLIAVGTPMAVLANARYALRHGGRVGAVSTGVGSAA